MYWVRRSLRRVDREKILFINEKYFELDGIFNLQNDRIYASSRKQADDHGGTKPTAKFPKKIMVWLGASKNCLTAPLIFKPGET